MSTRVVLLCAGATAATREGRFAAAGEPLDEGGGVKVRAFEMLGPAAQRCYVSTTAAAIETAELMAIEAIEEPALRDVDAGDWAGMSLSVIDPGAVAAWLAAPERGAAGGESMAAVVDRVGCWLESLGDGRVLAITHPAVARAAIGYALAVPVGATMAIDLGPLSMVVLSRHGRWRLQELRPGR